MAEFLTFKGSWPWPWRWIGSYGIPSCITHRPLPTYQMSLKSKKLFVDGRTEGRTYGRADGDFSTHVIRSTRRSRPKSQQILLILLIISWAVIGCRADVTSPVHQQQQQSSADEVSNNIDSRHHNHEPCSAQVGLHGMRVFRLTGNNRRDASEAVQFRRNIFRHRTP